MGIDQVVVFCLLLIIGLFFFVFILDYMMPLYLKFEFDSLCRDYALLIEAQNGLDNNQRDHLAETLGNRRINVLKIECSKPNHIKKGDWIHFTVAAEYQKTVFKALFERETITYGFNFTQEIISNKASN